MCVCVQVCLHARAHSRARRWVGLVVSLVFCDDDVFSVFRGMPRAALIVTELGPRATLVRMHAVALAFSVLSPFLSPPHLLHRPPAPSSRARRQVVQHGASRAVSSALRGRTRLSLGQVDGCPAAITPRLHTHARMHIRTRHVSECVHALYLLVLQAERIIVMIRFSVVLVTRTRDVLISDYELCG